jgi:serine/threonine-protein kinase
VVLGIVGGYFAYDAYQDNTDDEPEVVTVTTGETETGMTTGETTTTVEAPPEPVSVPDVVGQSYVEAGSSLEGQGLVADSYPVASSETRGTVVAQRPNGGTQAEEGGTVRNNVALGGGERPTREVPDVTGPQASDARATLRTSGFTVRTMYRRPPSAEEEGEVLTQDPAPGPSRGSVAAVAIMCACRSVVSSSSRSRVRCR